MEFFSLALGEVETRGSTQCIGKPLPQCKPSASRCDATSEKMEKLRPKKLNDNYWQGYLSNYSSGIRLLRVPMQIGPKNAPECKKSYNFWDVFVQHLTALDLN